MKYALTLVITATTSFATSAKTAEVAVFPVNAINLDAGQAEAIGAVLARAYSNAAKVEVLTPQATRAQKEENGTLAAAAAALSVREYLETTAVGLASNQRHHDDDDDDDTSNESRIIIQTSRHHADGTMIYKAEMTAISAGDIEVVAERLAIALYEKKPPVATLGIHNVSSKEASAENRTFVEKLSGVKTSVMLPLAKGHQYQPMVMFGYDLRLEGSKYFIEFGAGMSIPTDSTEKASTYGTLYSELGGSYYLTDTSISPYVGGGVLPRIVIGGSETEGGANMAVYGQAGVMFARESSTRLYADLRVAQNVIPVHHAATTLYGERQSVYPTEICLEVGIGW